MNLEKQRVLKENSIYGKLFRLAADELEKCDIKLPCSKSSFEASIGAAPKEIDIKPLLKLKGKEFADALWLSFFQKLPDEQKTKRLQDCGQAEILKAAAGEGAFAIRDLKPVNSPYGAIKTGLKGKALKVASGVKNSIFLRKLAKKMPTGIQNRIRGLFC